MDTRFPTNKMATPLEQIACLLVYICLLYKLQTEPKVKPASLQTSFSMQLKSRSMLLQSISGLVYELNI